MHRRLIAGSAFSFVVFALLTVVFPGTRDAMAADGFRRLEHTTGNPTRRPSETSITLIGSCDTPGYAQHVAVEGRLACVADATAVQVIDIADPAHPALIGSCATPGTARGVAVVDTLCFVADGDYVLEVIDIADPAHPVLIGGFDTGSPFGPAGRVAADGDIALVADGEDGLMVFNVSNPQSPILVGGSASNAYYSGDVAIEGDLAVGDIALSVVIFDASDPFQVRKVGEYATPGIATGVAIAGDLLFVSEAGILPAGDVLWVLSVADPANPVPIGSYGPACGPTGVRDLDVQGNLVFTVGEFGLQIIDVSDPTSPAPFASQAAPGQFGAVAVVGNLAFVASGESGLQILKVGLPVSASGECPVDMAIPGYSTVPSISLVGFRITNTGTTPAALSYSLDTDGPATLVDKGNPSALSGTTPLLDPGASYYPPEAGLVIPDIRTYSTQRIRYVVEFGAYSCETVITFEPPVPTLISAFEATPIEGGVRLSWAVHSDENIAGFKVYRTLGGGAIWEEITPAGLIPCDATTYVDRGATCGRTYEYTLVAILVGGREVRSPTVIAKPRAFYTLALGQNVPNPFNPTTKISFVLPSRNDVRIEIYDVEGRWVRTLVDNAFGEGRHDCTWDGKNNDGSAVGSGLYFYRLTVGTQRIAKKMLLLR